MVNFILKFDNSKTKNVASILSKNSWLLHKQLKWILIMPPTSFWINVYFEISDTSIPFDPTVFSGKTKSKGNI